MDQLFNIISFFQIGILAKIFLLVLIAFYLVFAVVIYKQISLMTQVLNSAVSPAIRLVAIFQMVAIIFLFFLAVVLI